MNPFMDGGMQAGFGQQPETNLFNIIVSVLFGLVGGLMLFVGAKEVIAYGSKLAGEAMKLTGYGQQMAAFGFATSAAPYIILAPLAGIAVKQLSGVRSIKGFAYFAVAVLAGGAAAYFGKGYFAGLMG
jgi:hypothetical protein